MKNFNLFLVTFIIFIIFSAFGCGKMREDRITKKSTPSPIINKFDTLEIPDSIILSKIEKGIAYRVCTNLKKKRIQIENSILKNTDKINYEKKQESFNCNNVITSTRTFLALIIKASKDLEYEKSADLDFIFTEVITDEIDVLKGICEDPEKLKTESEISNQVKNSNTTDTVTFKQNDSIDNINIITKDNSKEKSIVYAQSIIIRDDGVESERRLIKACPDDAKKFSSYKETFLKSIIGQVNK